MNILTLSDLSIGYGKTVIAERLNGELHSGELTCLVGRNGIGKSTLLRTLARFQPALGGMLQIAGRDINTLSRRELSMLVSIVMTARPDVQMMTAREVVALGRSPYTNIWGTMSEKDHSIAERCIKEVGAEHLAERRISTLSDGECQKVMIAKAMAQDTPIIILDEPTAFLDYPSKADTMRLIKDMTRRTGHYAAAQSPAALLSTHDMEMALKTADRLWVMTSDRQLVCGTVEEVKDILKEERLMP